MARMLRHKETGELFIWTSYLEKLPILELVVEDPVAKVIAEMAVQNAAEDVALDEGPVFEVPALNVVSAPSFVEAPAFVEAPVVISKSQISRIAAQKKQGSGK